MLTFHFRNEAHIFCQLIFIFAITEAAVTPTQPSCHADLIRAGTSCIRFSNRRMLSWKEAKAECAAKSASLLRFEDSNDVTAFAAVAQNLPVDGWWTDLTSQSHDGHWTWGTNQDVFPGSVVWNQEPDDVKHAENCVAVNHIGGASDQTCAKNLGFICEAKTVADGCDDGWSMSGSSCYYVSDTSDPGERVAWQQALQKCGQMASQKVSGPTLVSFQTKQEYTNVMALLRSAYFLGYRWWTGMNDIATEGRWRWADNTTADASVIQWESLPNSLQSTEQCGVVHSNGHISYSHCDRDHYFACRWFSLPGQQLELVNLGCQGIWLRGGQKCYILVTNTSMTRHDAQAFCRHRHGTLLKVESQDEMEWLQKQTALDHGFWTGLERSPSNNQQWQWYDGSSANMDLIHWHMEPNNLMSSENCALILPTMEYIDVNCFSQAGYICEMQTEDAPCSSDWIPWNSPDNTNCYYISNVTSSAIVTWAEARELCRQLSKVDEASLLAINSDAEKTFIKSQLSSKHAFSGWWTDLTDAGHEGAWVYADSWNGRIVPGSINWAREPNNRGGNEKCTVMNSGGQYNDVPCDSKASVACQNYAFGISASKSKHTSGTVLLSIMIVIGVLGS